MYKFEKDMSSITPVTRVGLCHKLCTRGDDIVKVATVTTKENSADYFVGRYGMGLKRYQGVYGACGNRLNEIPFSGN